MALQGSTQYLQGGGMTGNLLQSDGQALNIQAPYSSTMTLQPATTQPIQGGNTTTSYQQPVYGDYTSTSYYGGGSTGGSTAPTVTYGSDGAYTPYSSADWAYLDDQQRLLEQQRGLIDQTQQSGLTQLGDSYNREVTGANTKQSRALEDFMTKRTDTARAKDGAIGRVNTNARTLADSLRRRIGMASGSGSSAYQITAPNAVAREATKNRTGVVENFGQNVRDLDTTEKRVKEDFTTLLQDLLAQKKSRESDFMSGVLGQRNAVDQSLAEVARQRALLQGGGYAQVRDAMNPYSNAIQARQAEIGGLFDKYRTPFAVKQVDVNAPNLRDYTVDRAAIGGGQAQTDPYAPYTNYVKRDEEEMA